MLNEYCDNAVCDLKKALNVETETIDLLEALEKSEGDKFINSIKKSVSFTKIVMNHINEMIRVYRLFCDNSDRPEDLRRYRILEYRYLKKMRAKDICEKEQIYQSTYYRDNQEIIRVLSALIFGVGGLI